MSEKKTFVPSITTEQVLKIKARIREAIREYGETVEDKEAYKKDVDGLIYKSSNGKNVYLDVPTRSQRRKIKKEYLRGIQIRFNRNHKLHYHLKFVGINKKLFVPSLLVGIATTGGATGAAIYYGLNGVATVTITVDLDGGEIQGHEGDTLEVKQGTTYGELPTPTKTAHVFVRWLIQTETNSEPADPAAEVTNGVKIIAEWQETECIALLFDGSTHMEFDDNDVGQADKPWNLYINGKPQTSGVTWTISTDKSIGSGKLEVENGLVKYEKIPNGEYKATIKASKYDEEHQKDVEATETIDLAVSQETAKVTFSTSGVPSVVVYQGETELTVIADHDGATNPTTFGELLKLAPTPVLAGYELEDWYNNASCTGDPIDPSATFTADGTNTIYPRMKHIITPSISGGSLFINNIDDEAVGSDTNAWKLYLYEGAPAEQGVSWSITTHTGLGINTSGQITWDHLAQGEYHVTVKGSKSGYSAEAEVTIIVSDAMVDVDFAKAGTEQLEGQTHFDAIKYQTGKTNYTKFGDLNPPKAILPGQHVDHWYYLNGSTPVAINPNDYFTADTVLYPAMVPTVNPYIDGGEAALVAPVGQDCPTQTPWSLMNEQGQAIQTGVTWSLQNKPSFVKDLTISQGKATITWNTPTSENIGEHSFELQAEYAGMTYSQTIVIVVRQETVGLSFAAGSQYTGVSFLGSTSLTIDKGSTWSSVSSQAPVATIADETKQFRGWSTNAGTYNAITPQTQFTQDNTTLYAFFEQAPIQSLKIECADSQDKNPTEIITTLDKTYKAVITPAITTTVTWSVIGWDGATEAKPDIDQTGKVTTKNGSGTLTIQAAVPSTEIKNTLSINVIYPYEDDTTKIWSYVTLPSGQAGWASLEERTLCGEETGIWATPLGTSEHVVLPRTSETQPFDFPLDIGEDVISIDDNFLVGCTQFNSPITFRGNSKCILIGDNFIAGDTITEEDPADWTTMAFAKPLTLPSNLKEIGSDFLHGCISFDQTLTIPNTVTDIGDSFLWRCQSFNKDLIIPATVGDVGNDFMFGCDKYTAILTISTDPINFAFDGGLSLTLATDAASPLWLQSGIKIRCSAFASFLSRFPNMWQDPPEEEIEPSAYNRYLVQQQP